MRRLVTAIAPALLAATPALAQDDKTIPAAAHLLPDGAPTVLVGRWGDNGDCKHDVLLREDGSFHSYTGGEGRWNVAADVLTMAGPGGAVRLRVLELDRDEMTVQNSDGSIGHSQRCDDEAPSGEDADAG